MAREVGLVCLSFPFFLMNSGDDVIGAQRDTILPPIKFHKDVVCSVQRPGEL